ncbi:MAG TPA: ion channel [Polyangia bacterium]|nr:ion channel [Polyangia bacterium]
MKPRRPHRQTIRAPGANYKIHIVGDQRKPLRDFYHAILRRPWWFALASITAIFLGANAVFAVLYLLCGGIAHAAPASFADAFFFSVQTMGTIGYGAMYPETRLANVIVVAESLTSLTLTALFTGLVFAKFSRSTARMIFSREAVISPMDGQPALTLRLGNQRGNQIVDARITVNFTRKERTAEGHEIYRALDLPLVRHHVLSLSRSWSVTHRIDASSPFHGQTPESITAQEVEIVVMVIGIDDTTMQPVHASHRYFAGDILWGRRHADVLSELPNGDLVLDLGPFHDTVPTAPTERFPYPRP